MYADQGAGQTMPVMPPSASQIGNPAAQPTLDPAALMAGLLRKGKAGKHHGGRRRRRH
jgi:hypothetical protein